MGDWSQHMIKGIFVFSDTWSSIRLRVIAGHNGDAVPRNRLIFWDFYYFINFSDEVVLELWGVSSPGNYHGTIHLRRRVPESDCGALMAWRCSVIICLKIKNKNVYEDKEIRKVLASFMLFGLVFYFSELLDHLVPTNHKYSKRY